VVLGKVKVTQIFERIRIIDLSQGMAGPMATMIFADYGAEVIPSRAISAL
jgi:crotonobetainyl-CoA:carnitine CoA-transferase CaiB-like acyl-CoA transferase